MSDISPWQGEGKKRRFNWLMVHLDVEELSKMIDNKKGSYYYSSELYDQINGAFSNNEWLFQRFISFYEPMIQGLKYKITKVTDMTFDEYDDYIFKEHGYRVNNSWFIFRWDIPWLNISLYLTDQMAEGMYAATGDFDPMLELFADDFFGIRNLLADKKSYFVDSPEIQAIQQLFKKICNVYLPLYVFIVEGDYEGRWVDALPNEVREKFDKMAKFSKSLEEIEWTDIQESGYLFYYYLVRCCNYPGVLANDEDDNDKEGE